MFVKCKELNDHIAEITRRSVGILSGKIFALEMHRCALGEGALRKFFAHFSPDYLHLAGLFDRSLISDKVLPLSNLFSLFIGVHPFNPETPTKISAVTVRKIFNNWIQQHPNISRDLRSSFDTCGPSIWVQQGLCRRDDVELSCHLSCYCHGEITDNLPRNSSQLCDSIYLDIVIRVFEPHRPPQSDVLLLDIRITLYANQFSIEKIIPFDVSKDTRKRPMSIRT
ncbi:hypothetical protein KIN20_006338 [Parelaphostrongylus tenuis]|uniref:Uncharacterized protein n=1 Tax=Parelaphostrongylus tenuis TaxID=148309 RepID=A0AAD5QFW9_PARTN|nr:hypothetical protein KIN20_006338 [Parelaphostrongylus tenuis]